MKKFFSLLIIGAMLAFVITSCGSGNEDGNADETQDDSEAAVAVDFTESYNAVIDAYGEYYMPNMDLESTMLSEIYGINMDNVEEFFGQAPMISTNVDTFIAIKAKEGMGTEVAEDLNAYRDKLVNDSLNYPMNIPKIEASEVVVYGDYVYFLMLGQMFEDYEAPEEEHLSFYQSETQKGKDALSALFEG